MSHRIFEFQWWTGRIPEGWIATPDSTCVSLTYSGEGGTLQISAYQKDSEIADDDLTDLANDDSVKSRPLQRVRTASFTGLYAERNSAEMHMREWWLRSGCLLLYVTHVQETPAEHEQSIVNQIIESLRPLHGL